MFHMIILITEILCDIPIIKILFKIYGGFCVLPKGVNLVGFCRASLISGKDGYKGEHVFIFSATNFLRLGGSFCH